MAMSEQVTQKGEGSEPRRSGNAVSQPLFLMNGVVEDKPNNYWDWRPSSTFMENPQHANSAKSKNKNKEQGTPNHYGRSSGRKHRPATFPRTAVSGREKAQLEDLVHHFTFSDVEEKSVENGYEGINLSGKSKPSSRRGPRPSDVIDLPQQADSIERHSQQNEMPNRNQIVARLMQIREYIRQASSMLSNIDGPGMAGLQNEQILKLGQLQEHLKEQERGYLILLEKMLGEDTVTKGEGRSSQNSGESFATSVAESASINVDACSDISETSTDDVQVNEQIEVLAGLQQQHDLLKKMLQQQEELRNLQNRQTSLMKLQEQIETRLAANETSTEATPSEVSQKTEGSTTVTEASAAPSDAESERYKQALEDLRRRTLLRMLNEDRSERLQELIASTRMEEQREQEKVDLISAEHRELQDKLKTLQQKKMDMDALLQELHSLGGGILDSVSSLDPASEAEGSQAGRNQTNGGGDVGNQEMVTNGSESLSKLQEVRHRLTELRDLVQEYQDTANEVPNNVHNANYEDPELMSNLRKLERGELIGRYRGPHANNHNQASTQTVAPPLINQSEDETQGTPSVTEDETETENESEQSSIPVAWAEDPELRDKFRKLETAKQKLRELQELVSIVQETPEAAVGLPDDLAELAMSLTEDVSEVTDEEEDSGNEDEEGAQGNKDEEKESGVSEVYSELSEGEVPEQTREAYYEAKMRQQRRELEKLMEERGRLLNVQRQLKELNQKLPPISMINNFSQEHGKFQNRRVQTSSNMQDVLTPSRDEVYAEMRRHKILQEELRQKKRELAVLMAKVKKGEAEDDDMNDLEDNDLFRVSMRSADVTAAATWGGSSQMSDGEDDGYPNDDVILAEEEEEEEEGNSIAMTSDTYTVETPQFNPQRPTVLPNDSDYDESLLEMHGIRFPRRTPRQQYSNLRQENLRPAADLVEDASEYPRNYVRLQMQVDNLEKQLEESIHLTQSLVKDQQSIMNLLYHSMSGSNPPIRGLSPSPAPPSYSLGAGGDPRLAELLHDYDLRLQHQQLMLNLNNAYNDLFKQQEAIENFYKVAEQSAKERENVNSNNNAYEGMESEQEHYVRDMFSPFGRPSYEPDSMYEQKYGSQEPSDTFNLAPTFPQGFSQSSQRGTYLSQEVPSYLNQYNSYARQQTARYTNPYETSVSYHVPPNSSQRSFESNDQDGRSSGQQGENSAPRTASDTSVLGMKNSGTKEMKDVAQNTESPVDVGVPRLDINSLLRKTERQRMKRMEKDLEKKQRTPDNPQGTTSKKGGSASSQAKSKVAARSKLTDANFSSPSQLRPSLSSHLSGTAFLDTASLASTMSYSSMPGELDQEGLRYLRPVGNESQRSIKSHSEVESEAGSEYSLFEALRESIYSEVATLISQNESRPHFLIELFRELQMLNTDYLRQRALYALQDLVSKFLTDDSGPQDMEEFTGSYLHWPYTTISEHTPSESFFTSEEEEFKAQLYGQKPGLYADDSKGSLSGLQYDYVENVDSASSMSTPPSVGGPGDFGFANDELGNTVIHLDKALQRMREYERMKAEAEASGGTSSSAMLSSKQEEAAPSASDVTSNSSAQDMGSESSFSDLPYPRIDTRQLDLQIKSIMQEVIPYLKEHMDDVCSSQLLAYIRRLVMNLARQRDDSREFVRFFNRQLGSILEDSLSKFSGRKMRECGEDLLVDISEILFNELAFFRLMQDLDTAGDKLKKEIEQEEKKDTTEAEESKGEEDEDEDDEDEEVGETTGTETGLEDAQYDEGTTDNTTTDEENEALAKTDDTMATVVEVGTQLVQEAMESAMAIASKFEAEELGKDRDDIFAAEVIVSECDEDSEPVDEKGIKIELSVSESNAVTYLGSEEEDDNDQEVVSHQNEETETSLGMSSHTPTDLNENTPQVEEVTPAKPEETPQEEPPPESSSEQVPKSETEEKQPPPTAPTEDMTTHPSDSPVENLSNVKDETVCSGELKDANENEVTLDDLPAKLTSLSQMEVEAKMGEESAESDVSKAVLESMVTGEDQLAGDGESLPEPEGMPAQNGLPEEEPAST